MIRVAVAIAVAQVAVGWQLDQHAATPSGMLALATVALAGAVIAVLGHAPGLGATTIAGPRLAVALRRRSWGAVFQRQRNPDAPGRARPRAPSAAPAAA
jgi:Flp pilus assembly CpaE family ATPase